MNNSLLIQLFDLSGRVAIVTGGASGIGAGISRQLAIAGATVIVADIDISAGQSFAKELCSEGASAIAIQLDIRNEDVVKSCFEDISREHGAPWILVNNAGIQNRKGMFEISGDDWDAMQKVNLRGAFLCLREAAELMKYEGQGGRIINISSASIRHPTTEGLAAYAASKGGLASLSQNAAFELLEHNITVNTILPGGVMTPGALGATGPAPSAAAQRRPPLGQCTPEDIAMATLFFASPAAQHITAQQLAVDGGWQLT